mgnify:FL=1
MMTVFYFTRNKNQQTVSLFINTIIHKTIKQLYTFYKAVLVQAVASNDVTSKVMANT